MDAEGSARWPARRRPSEPPQSKGAGLDGLRRVLDYVPIAAGPECSRGGREGRAGVQGGKPAHPLSQRAAERRPVGGPNAGRRRSRQGLANHHGEAVRHGSRERDLAQRELHEVFAEDQIFRIDHFLGKEPAQKFSPSGSPMACSSRSGTATSSTTSRSMCRRRWISASAPGSTSRPAPIATWSSLTSSRYWRSWRWSRRPRWSPGRSARRRTRSFAR